MDGSRIGMGKEVGTPLAEEEHRLAQGQRILPRRETIAFPHKGGLLILVYTRCPVDNKRQKTPRCRILLRSEEISDAKAGNSD
jgi:hypothetical protein